MDIILLQKIQNLGQLGDIVSVKAGYARNYLIPQGKALKASESAKSQVESRRAELVAKEKDELARSQGRADLFKDLELSIAMRASEEGRLFGSVSITEIMNAVEAKNLELSRSEVSLPDGPIKQIGDYEIELIFHPQVRTTLALKVVPE